VSGLTGPIGLPTGAKTVSLIDLIATLTLTTLGISFEWHYAECRGAFPACGLYYKQVTIVIYDHNDIGLYYKTRDNRN
jgi:hypothetical protein